MTILYMALPIFQASEAFDIQIAPFGTIVIALNKYL